MPNIFPICHRVVFSPNGTLHQNCPKYSGPELPKDSMHNPSIHIFLSLFIHLFVHPSIHSSMHPSIHHIFCLFIHTLIVPYIKHLSIACCISNPVLKAGDPLEDNMETFPQRTSNPEEGTTPQSLYLFHTSNI
jgi:hypothetical protein